MTIKLREEILETAHLDSSKKLAREYFEKASRSNPELLTK